MRFKNALLKMNTICGSWRLFIICLCVMAPEVVQAVSLFPSLTDPVRKEIERVESELASLPVFPINTSPWTMGYSSAQHKTPILPVKIEINFLEPDNVDHIVLMPGSYTSQRNQIESWGFPVRFMIERILSDGSIDVIADFRDKDYPNPGFEPQFFSCPDKAMIKGLRITVSKLAKNPTWWRASHLVSFSELYAFSGKRNVALNAKVRASSSNEFGFMWSAKCLTDGFTLRSPLFHDVEDPENNIIGHDLKKLQLDIDLGKVCEIDEFHLWPVVHSIQHNYPPSSGMGFPLKICLESSLSANFSDSEVIYETVNLAYRPGAGPFMHQTRSIKGRFLRFTFGDGFPDFIRDPPTRKSRIALSEIEILCKGEVLSRGAKVKVSRLSSNDQLRVASLTDGRSNEGQILPLRYWLDQFKLRIRLQAELRSLRLDLDVMQRREERYFRTSLLFAIGLILILLQLIWLVRVAARRRASKMRERIACDLHDEIGANVSSMAHTAELLSETIKQPSSIQTRLLGNLVENARMTSRETKHFIRFIEGENYSRDIAEQLTQVASQILGTISAVFTLENTRNFNALDPETKWNLLLFYKETLNNIIKHAGASEVMVKTFRQNKELVLEISDNGCGMVQENVSCRHLEERAAMLNGKLLIESQLEEGTRIILHFNSSNRRK